MAFLRRIPRSPYWIGVFVGPDGRRASRSTKTRDRKAALRMVDAWEEAGRLKLTETQTRKVIADIFQKKNGRPLVLPTLGRQLEEWLARKQVEVRPITFQQYASTMRKDFLRFFSARADEPLENFVSSDIAHWRDQVATRTSARTANNKLKVARIFFQAAFNDSVILENPAAKVKLLRANASSRRPFTLDQMRAVVSVTTGEWRGMILFGLYTGQRLKDIALLTWAQVDMENGLVRLITSKTQRDQRIPLAQPVLNFLSGLPSSDDPTAPLFPEAHRIVTTQQRTTQLSGQFYDVLAAAGLVAPRPRQHRALTGVGRAGKRTVGQLSFHSLRHSATSLLKQSGAPEAVVRDIIGHDSELVSRQYTHICDDQKRAAVAKLPLIEAP